MTETATSWVRRCEARHGWAWQGRDGLGVAGMGSARPGEERQGSAGLFHSLGVIHERTLCKKRQQNWR
jgi:hypothetical protein